MVFQQADVGVAADALCERGLHRASGGVGSVHDAPFAVAAFAGEVVAGGFAVVGEGHALGCQPVDHFPALADHEAGDVFVAEAGAGDQGVADMGLHRVVAVEHGCNAALCPGAGAVQELALGQDGDMLVLREMERGGEGSEAAADDEDFAAVHDWLLIIKAERP